MKLITFKTLGAMTLLICLSSTAHATLISRLGGQALYDDVLDVTWLSNANLALDEQFGLTLSTNVDDDTANTVGSTGKMTWENAKAWVAGMNSASHLGLKGWRLPNMDINDDDTFINCTGGGVSGCSDNEYGHLFYETGITEVSPGIAPNNFTNLQPGNYWSGQTFTSFPSYAWFFDFIVGNQAETNKSINHFALAVRSGDVAAVPVPAAVWLMGSALFGLAGFRRKKAISTKT